MPQFTTTRRIPHSATDMFDLVANVEAYPQFLPLCESLVVRSRRQDGSRETLVATMTIAYKLIRESFTTKVVLDREAMTIRAEYLDGPFSHLENVWRFEPHGRGDCIVYFDIDYAFRSRMLGVVMGAVFDRAFRKFTEAFEERADEVYGAPA
ncbi:type II toxin-antitoxin system RatA family toxin [Bauldia litoralis]|uniref:Coenzyme Q-binding protein COQ10 n=1 Tax=Bauldia litoralis TaxID=665467 RepID=A0A1G6AZ10_9HYPH|nr:type II toxin-antitoxin system RatA family toxin [Bauldia litoralis]SDB13636.1 coenzyme Q-binding protein COQ10 [Bauldia litoralis]